jgi:hypothetical protein
MKTTTHKRVLASFSTPYHGSVEIIGTSSSNTFAVFGDYHPDDAKVLHLTGSARQCYYAARTAVRGYGRSKLSLNRNSL